MQISLEQIHWHQGVDNGLLFASLTGIDSLVERTVNELRESVDKVAYYRQCGIYIGHSGGKDSCVIHWLMQLAFPGNRYPVVHTPKTTGPNKVHEETRNFLYSLPFPIIYLPAEHHDSYGWSVQVDGSRRDEYNRTDGRSTHIVVEGKEVSREHMTMFVRNGLFGLDFIYPIVDWTNEDVWACIHKNKIEISPEYLLG